MTELLKDATRDQIVTDADCLLALLNDGSIGVKGREAEALARAVVMLRNMVMLHDMGEQTPQDRRSWICRESSAGRGLRLHQASALDAWDCQRHATPWAALPSAGE